MNFSLLNTTSRAFASKRFDLIPGNFKIATAKKRVNQSLKTIYFGRSLFFIIYVPSLPSVVVSNSWCYLLTGSCIFIILDNHHLRQKLKMKSNKT